MKTYFRILQFGRPYRRFALPYFVSILLHTIFNTITFVMLIPIIETLFNSQGMMVQSTVLPDFSLTMEYFKSLLNYLLFKTMGTGYNVKDMLILIAIMTIVVVFLSNLFRYLAQRTMENLRIFALQRLRDGVYEKVIKLQVSYFSNERKGDIISKITSDVQVVQFCITNTLQVLFKEPMLIVGYIWVLLSISVELTLFVVAVLPLIAFVIGHIVKKLRSSATQGQQALGDMVSLLDESLGAIKTIKAYNATEYVESKFKSQNSLYSNIMRSIANKQQLASPMSEFLGISTLAFLLVYGGNMIISGELNAGEFISYLAIFSQVTRPARAISDAFGNINQGIAAGERVLDLMDTPIEIRDKANAVELQNFEQGIEFRNVSFSYGDRSVLNNISFKIPKGQAVALVGPSGGGKSTISDLIPRFYDPEQGEILIDGRPLTDFKIESIRRLMGIVAQDTILFNDTIQGNIRMGNLDASNDDIERAIRVANAAGFVEQSEAGLETNIGDRGLKLSGGQRQRISIARAVLRDPEILILDEATSALDTESERLVQESLQELLKGRTSLVIAHRLSTVQHCDNIIVVQDGEIVEQGRHEELMAINGVYSHLVSMQSL